EVGLMNILSRVGALVIAPSLLLAACGGSASAPAPSSLAPAASSPAPKPAASAAASTTASAGASAKPAASGSAAAKPAASASNNKITITYSNITGDNLASWIAKDGGYLQKNGLNADMILIAGGAKTMGALLSGEVQVAQLGGGE